MLNLGNLRILALRKISGRTPLTKPRPDTYARPLWFMKHDVPGFFRPIFVGGMYVRLAFSLGYAKLEPPGVVCMCSLLDGGFENLHSEYFLSRR